VFFLFDIAAAAVNNLFTWLKNFMRIWRNVSQTRCFAGILHTLLQDFLFFEQWLQRTFLTTSHSWSRSAAIILLHLRQQEQLSADNESQKWGASRMIATERRIKPEGVWGESTTSDNKDKGTAAATQAHFAEVTDALDEATRFSQPWAPLWAWPWSQCQYHTQKTRIKLTEAMIEVWGLIGIVIWVSKQGQCEKVATVWQLMLMSCKREVERKCMLFNSE